MRIVNHPPAENNHKTHWRPGEPIPPAGSGIDPDAYEALARNAEAAEREAQRRRFQTRRDTRTADHCVEGRTVDVSTCRPCSKVVTFKPAARPVEWEVRRVAA